MGKWSELKASEKARIIQFAIQNGVSDINTIRDTYNEYAEGGSIHIAPSKKGTFTAVATKHGKSVQEFAAQVLSHKENYSPAMVKKAVFAKNFGGHRHDQTTEVSTLDPNNGYLNNAPNSKTYKRILYSEGANDLSGVIFHNLKNRIANLVGLTPHLYTGNYYFGNKYGYEGYGEKVPTERRIIDLYVNGDEKGFTPLTNVSPIVVNGDTLNYKQYQGSLLPQDTIYLRPESLKTVERLFGEKSILSANASFPSFMSHDINLLGHPYYLDNYRGKVMDDVNNIGLSFKKSNKGDYYIDAFDLWDLTGVGDSKQGGKIDAELQNDSIETNGPFILRQQIPIVFTRNGVSDGNFLNLISGGVWQNQLDKDKEKSTGGPLYPFSFNRLPIVRY